MFTPTCPRWLLFLLPQLLYLVFYVNLAEANWSCFPCTCLTKYYPQLNRWMNGAYCENKNISTFPVDLPLMLRNMDISYNPLEAESLQSLAQYSNLLALSLAHCKLRRLHDGTFANLTSLRLLDLTGNNLVRIQGATFNGLSSLRYLKGLMTEYAQRDSFRYLEQLRELEFSLGGVKPPGNLFHGLQLKELYLNLSSSTNVPQTLFNIANHSLQEVTLIGPRLAILPQNLFYGLMMLRTVKIDAPNLHSIPESSFKGSQAVRRLNSLGDRIDSAPLNLASITLSGMSIVPPNLFQYQQSVEVLKLSDIDTIPSDVFAHLQTLNSLDLSGCTLLEVPQLKALSGLKHLNMSKTNLQDIQPYILSGLHSLKSLDLSYNNITHIPAGIFEDVGITLVHLNLSSNSVEDLDSRAFDHVLGLKTLDLSSNNLSSLSASQFWSLRNLQALDLSDNFIQSLPDSLFVRQEDLVRVNLSNNKLKRIPDDLLSNMLALRFLDISNNQLTVLPPNIMQAFDLLSFDDNPILCDCNLYDILMRNHKSTITGKCDSPEEFAGTLLRKLDMSNLCVVETTTMETIVPTTEKPTTTTLPTTTALTEEPLTTTPDLVASPVTSLSTSTDIAMTKIKPDEVNEYIVYNTVNRLSTGRGYNKSQWFIACMSVLSILVSAAFIFAGLKCARTLMRSRVYEVNPYN